MTAKDNIELPVDMHGMFNVLPDADAGQLIKAIFTYAVNGEETVFCGKTGDMLASLFALMKIAIDSNISKKKRKESKEKNVSTAKHKYGVNGNVLLTDEEHRKLQDQFTKDCQKRIDALSSYLASSGKSYKSHYFTILNWARRDAGTDAPAVSGGSFDTDDFFQAALNRSYEGVDKK